MNYGTKEVNFVEQNQFQHMIKRMKEGALKDIYKQTVWIYQYVKRYWLMILIYTLIGMSGTVFALGSSVISKDLIDIITGQQTGALVKTFCAMLGLNLANLLVSQLSGYVSNWISMKVDTEIKSDIFSKMLITDWECLTSYHTGDLMTRWGQDASTISSGVLSWIPNLIINIFKFISAFAIVIYYDPTFAIFSFIGVPVTLLMSGRTMKRMVNNNAESAAMNAKMSGFNQEAFSNIQTIKSFSLIDFYVQELRQLQKDYIQMRLKFMKMSAFTSLIMSVVGLAVSYSSYGWGIYRVYTGVISYGTMTMFLTLSGTLTATLNALISLVPTAINLTTSAKRLMDILDMPKEDYSMQTEVDAYMEQYQQHGISLQVNHINYTYQNGNQVFEDASFEANPHEIIALVGPSGKGKTTMLRLLLALLSPGQGEIVLGNPIDNKTLVMSPAARKLFSYVPQGNTMFSGTIAENMRNIKPDATDEEIITALKLACAWEFVEPLPNGIHSMIKERGGGFSEGQAQRLSIARALLRKSPILLLDEATSALDMETERKVIQNIMEDDYPRTCIVTTHRPGVLEICHRVYTIDNKTCYSK